MMIYMQKLADQISFYKSEPEVIQKEDSHATTLFFESKKDEDI